MSIADFLLNLDRSVSEYTEHITTTESSTVTDRRLLMLKMINVSILYNLLIFYFRNTGISSDQNMMTSDEIKLVISKLNNIMDTYLEVEV